MDARTRRILGDVDVKAGRGLEIGPLHRPIVAKADANVTYVDHASAEQLRSKYRDDPPMAQYIDQIVEVDVVVAPHQRLIDAFGDDAFDYVIASHVVEHIPDPVGWLNEISAVLVDGGALCLAVPDQRYCFDAARGLTSMADLIDAHLRGIRVPSL